MNLIPPHTRRLVEKLLTSYCARVCPPSARHAVELRFEVARDRVRLGELRRFCGVPGAHQLVPVAEFRYHAASGEWRLYHVALRAGKPARWRSYPELGRTRNFVELLRRFDADPAARFWSRLNGGSLRWCRAGGRCEGCDHRYGRILGLEGARLSPGVPRPVTRLGPG